MTRILVVSAAMASLAIGGFVAPSSAHHYLNKQTGEGHHCQRNPQSKEDVRPAIRELREQRNQEKNREERKALSRRIRELRHSTHKCAPGRYPPS